jgi:hypothetical protein
METQVKSSKASRGSYLDLEVYIFHQNILIPSRDPVPLKVQMNENFFCSNFVKGTLRFLPEFRSSKIFAGD